MLNKQYCHVTGLFTIKDKLLIVLHPHDISEKWLGKHVYTPLFSCQKITASQLIFIDIISILFCLGRRVTCARTEPSGDGVGLVNVIIFLAVQQTQALLFHDQFPVGWGGVMTFMFLCTHRRSNLVNFLAVQQTQALLIHDQLLVGWGGVG